MQCVKRGVESGKCGVLSVECESVGVESVKCKVWSVKRKV